MISSSPEQGVVAQSSDSMNKGISRLCFKTKSGSGETVIEGRNCFLASSRSLLCTGATSTFRYFSDIGEEAMVYTLRVRQNKQKYV